MSNLLPKNLKSKLMVMLVVTALVPAAVVGLISLYSGKASMGHLYLNTFAAIRDIQKMALTGYVNDCVRIATFLAEQDRVYKALETTRTAETGATVQTASGEAEAAKITFNRLSALSESFIKCYDESGLNDLLVIRPDGTAIYSAKKLGDLGANLKTGDLKDSGLGKVWARVMRTQRPCFEDTSIYQPLGKPAAFVGVPVLHDNKFLGVLVLRMGFDYINKIMKVPDSAGKTAETYLVGKDGLMRSQSRFEKESTIMAKKVSNSSVELAQENKTGAHIVADYRGIPCVSAYSDAGLGNDKNFGADFRWSILAEVDEEEATEPVVALAWRIAGIGVIAAIAVALLAFFVARSISRPVTALAGIAADVSKGNLGVEVVHLDRDDEIGSLADAFREMVANLRDQVSQILEGVSVLSSAAAEISTTVAELTQNTSRTSAAVTETSTTVEQVKQSAQVASEKANKVAQEAMEAVQISENGRKATEDTIHRMNLIKEQMESVGETVVRLSEHSQAIENIINTVQDIADQSNLLAVNASIEAARAGDHGKGFAVVAHEIKSLADQSKQATDQVRTILEDTRKWVSAVVMATEQGSKAVDAGVAQSSQAGGAIQSLADRVVGSAQAATVIGTSTQQQFTGVDQVATAMANIDQAMQQNLEGARQLENAAARLEDLGGTLKNLVQHYRV